MAKLQKNIQFSCVKLSALKEETIAHFKDSPVIGLAPGYSKRGRLVGLAICDDSNGLILELGGQKQTPAKARNQSPSSSDDSEGSTTSDSPDSPSPAAATRDPRDLLESTILCRESLALAITAFDFAPMACALHSDANLRVQNGLDVQALFPSDDPFSSRRPTSAVQRALQFASLDRIKPLIRRIEDDFMNPEFSLEEMAHRKELACRAWLACFLVSECVNLRAMDPEEVPRIDTKKMAPNMLSIFAKLASDPHKLSLFKSTTMDHKVSEVRNNDGSTHFKAAAHKHKFRGDGKGGAVTVQGKRGAYVIHETIDAAIHGSGVLGPSPAQHTRTDVTTSSVISVETRGRDDPTMAEARRSDALLNVLQGNTSTFTENPWVRNIWFPPTDGTITWPEEWAESEDSEPSRATTSTTQSSRPSTTTSTTQSSQPQRQPYKHSKTGKQPNHKIPRLNQSQQKAVNSMMGTTDQHRLVIVQGPPGTGKTSVIGAYVMMSTMGGSKGIWLVAQSNVAVKNIALKLISIGFEDWKILVSTDFHDGWHEHLYGDSCFKGHLFLSAKFKYISPRELIGVKVILATVSMLSNPRLSKFTKAIPMKTVVVDEASQIEIGAYVPMLITFPSIRKMCFIGDDKQLPPHGQEEVEDLQSVFEVPHLQKHVILLDTQYRMPPEIGDIISSAIYDDKLRSNPLHPITATTIPCYFIDVPAGRETQPKAGQSWSNPAEQDLVLKLAQQLGEAGIKFKIITPYEAQTNAIEAQMRSGNMAWEDTCFNVDAFQGNEEDFIIISLVRSQGLGFLDNLRRTNVMLTRCKRGMYIITSKKFMAGIGGDSLVGEMLDSLVEKWGDKVWLNGEDIEKGKISNV